VQRRRQDGQRYARHLGQEITLTDLVRRERRGHAFERLTLEHRA
jgi:hypothetical protein